MKNKKTRQNIDLVEAIIREISSNPNCLTKNTSKDVVNEVKSLSRLELQHNNESGIYIMPSVNTVVMNFDEWCFESNVTSLFSKIFDYYLKKHLEEKELLEVKRNIKTFIDRYLSIY